MSSEKGYEGLQARLDHLESLVDRMAARAAERRWSLDIVCLSEDANTAGSAADLGERIERLPVAAADPAGPTLTRMADVARRHRTYLIVPHFVRVGERVANSAVLLDRSGQVVGRYDKLHGIEWPELSGRVEEGCTPGQAAPVWDLDFGRVGLQICFDLLYDDGWSSLERRGAEIVFWPSAYPGVQHLAHRAWRHGYYVVSSPWRPPCAIYDPTGHAMYAADREAGPILVERIDLEYRLMPWKAAKDGGQALKAKYGNTIDLFYRRQEDVWLFWSNSDREPVGRILRDNELEPLRPYLERMRRLQQDVRGSSPLV
jgi:predicted amidohydrolase